MAKLSPLPVTLRTTFGFAAAPLILGALLLGGCDRESAGDAQPAETPAAAAAAPTGTIDRSFAGRIMPAAELTDPDGATLSLADTRGQPVLLNLWATWCVPCVTEMPLLDDLAGAYDGRMRVVTVSEDMQGAEKVVPFFEEKGFANLPRWMDEKNDLAVAFGGGAALPLTVLYDAQGREVWRVMGGYDWEGAAARRAIDAALAPAQ